MEIKKQNEVKKMEEKINKMVKLMSRADKINFLMKSNLFNINTLIEMNKEELNEMTITGLKATGFKFRTLSD